MEKQTLQQQQQQHPKKHKQIFDEKQKEKYRLNSLSSLLDSGSHSENLEFLCENKDDVFSLLDTVHERSSMKITAALAEQPELVSSLSSKRIIQLLSVYSCLRKVLLYCGRVEGWWTDDVIEFVVSHVSILLRYKNHHKIRLEGFRLLLICFTLKPSFINDNRFSKLFLASMILNPFADYLLNVKTVNVMNILSFEPLYALNDDNLILPAQSQTSAEETCEFFDTILLAITAASTNYPSFISLYVDFYHSKEREMILYYLFRLLKTTFLDRLYPKFHLKVPASQPLFRKCPPEFQRSLITTLARYVIKYSSFESSDILHTLFFGPDSIEYGLEIVKSSLTESFQWLRTINYGIYIIRGWILLPVEFVGSLSLDDSLDSFPERIHFCFSYLEMILETKFDEKTILDQISVYNELLDLIRTTVTCRAIAFEKRTWEMILNFLLKFQTIIAETFKFHKSHHEVANLVNYSIETLLISWIRSRTENRALWEKLRNNLSSEASLAYTQTVSQWGNIMKSLANIYLAHILGLKTEFSTLGLRSEKNLVAKAHLFRNISDTPSLDRAMLRQDGINGSTLFGTQESIEANQSMDAFDTSKFFSSLTFTKQLNSSALFDQERIRFSSHPNNAREIPLKESSSTVMHHYGIKSADFTLISNMPTWSAKNSKFSYHNMLRIIGNVNLISSPDVHLEAMQSILSLEEIWLQARFLQPSFPLEYPPLYETCPWIWECIDLDESFSPSKRLAHIYIGKLLTNVSHNSVNQPKPQLDFYSNSYFTLIKGLLNFSRLEVSAIIQHTSRLFSLNVPGSEILIPNFICCLSKYFGIDSDWSTEIDGRSCSDEDIQAAEQIASSIYFPSFIAEDEICVSTLPYYDFVDGSLLISKYYTLPEIHQMTTDLIFGLTLRVDSKQSQETKASLVCAVSLVFFKELASINVLRKFNQVSFETALKLLLHCLQDESSLVMGIAVDCLSCLVQSKSLLAAISDHVYRAIVENYLAAITDKVYFAENSIHSKNMDIPRLLYGFLDWLMNLPVSLSEDLGLKNQIFDAIENIITDANMQITSAFLNMKNSSKRSSRSRKTTANREVERLESPLGSPKSESFDRFPPSVELDGADLVRETAENILMHFLNFYRCFPSPAGPASLGYMSLDDIPTEHDKSTRSVITIHDKIILVLEERNGLSIDLDFLRIVVRNALGKFVWDIEAEEQSLQTNIMQEYKKLDSRWESFSYDCKDVDYDNELKEIMLAIRQQNEINSSTPERKISRSHFQIFKMSTVKVKKIPSINEFLFDMNLVKSESQLKTLIENTPLTIQYLKETPAFWRDIKGLDKKYGRECVKVALIYAAAGQEDEYSILSNEYSNASTDYHEFVHSLGWIIDIEHHQGFLAGLEKSGTNGKTATYFANSTLEMIFHDVTQMPNDPDDTKQVKKKRHIGNDQVHVIWNEHFRQYKPTTIGGDFGNIQIIISPLSKHCEEKKDGYYAIDIRKGSKAFFGPLLPSMVIPKYLLGPLVRSTAINAYRSSLNETGISYKRPCHYRMNDIRLISSRYRIDKTLAATGEKMSFGSAMEKKSSSGEATTSGSSSINSSTQISSIGISSAATSNGFDLFLKQTLNSTAATSTATNDK